MQLLVIAKWKPNSDAIKSDNKTDKGVIGSCRETLSPILSTKLAFSMPRRSDLISPTRSLHYLLEMKEPNLRLIPALCTSPDMMDSKTRLICPAQCRQKIWTAGKKPILMGEFIAKWAHSRRGHILDYLLYCFAL